MASRFDTIAIAQKNSQGRRQYMEHASAMIKYFNEVVLKDKEAVDALGSYKLVTYGRLNAFLLQKLEPRVHIDVEKSRKSPSTSGHEWIEKLRQNAFQHYLNYELQPLVQMVSTLDRVILNAPQLFTNNIKVYRGMPIDIQDDIECQDGKYFYTFKNYVSASFTPSVSKRFGSVMYTLILDKDCKGMYVSSEMTRSTSTIQDLYLDSEVEFMIGRGAKFEVINVEVVPSKRAYLKYKDITCKDKKNVFYTKHYTLRFVSQPSKIELASGLKTLAESTKESLPYTVTYTV